MATAAKPKAQSLHLGLNLVDPKAYAGWDGPLSACEFDAHDMAALATQQGMKAKVLLTKQATRAKVLAALRASAKALGKGDFFFLSFSGHGGQVPDAGADEADGQDETWCLFDGQLLDDELYFELSRFAAGVRILVLSDSCHSGTVTKAMPAPFSRSGPRARMLPPAVARRTYQEHKAFYDRLNKDITQAMGGRSVDPDAALANVSVSGRLTQAVKKFKPSVILISGCQDNQTSMDGEHNGAFTEALLKVWADGQFKGGYSRFHTRIRAQLPASQSPNLFTLGPVKEFLTQKPFSVG